MGECTKKTAHIVQNLDIYETKNYNEIPCTMQEVSTVPVSSSYCVNHLWYTICYKYTKYKNV